MAQETWRNLNEGTVYITKLDPSGKRQEPIVGKRDFVVTTEERIAHTNGVRSPEKQDPYSNGQFRFVKSDADSSTGGNAPLGASDTAAVAAASTHRPLEAPAPVADEDLTALNPAMGAELTAAIDLLDELEVAQARAILVSLRQRISEDTSFSESLVRPFSTTVHPEVAAAAAVADVVKLADSGNPNQLSDEEMAIILAGLPQPAADQLLEAMTSPTALEALLATARAGSASPDRQQAIATRLQVLDPHAAGLPRSRTLVGGDGDSTPDPQRINMDQMHEPDLGDPSIPAVTADGAVLASTPPAGIPDPQPLPPHLAAAFPTN